MTTPRVNRPYRKTGRKRKDAPANISTARSIEVLAASGLKIIGIAKALKTSKERLRRWMDEDPELLEAFERGLASAEFEMYNFLYRTVKNHKEETRDRIAAATFLLRARFGWREGAEATEANKVSITFTLPGALKPEEFSKVIEHGPSADAESVPRKALTRS